MLWSFYLMFSSINSNWEYLLNCVISKGYYFFNKIINLSNTIRINIKIIKAKNREADHLNYLGFFFEGFSNLKNKILFIL